MEDASPPLRTTAPHAGMSGEPKALCAHKLQGLTSIAQAVDDALQHQPVLATVCVGVCDFPRPPCPCLPRFLSFSDQCQHCFLFVQVTSQMPPRAKHLPVLQNMKWPFSSHLQNFRMGRSANGDLFALLTLLHRPLAVTSNGAPHGPVEIDLSTLVSFTGATQIEVSALQISS